MEELKTLAVVGMILQAAPLWLVRQPALAVSHLASIWAEWAASQGDPSSPITTCSSPSAPVPHHMHHLFLTICTTRWEAIPTSCTNLQASLQHTEEMPRSFENDFDSHIERHLIFRQPWRQCGPGEPNSSLRKPTTKITKTIQTTKTTKTTNSQQGR